MTSADDVIARNTAAVRAAIAEPSRGLGDLEPLAPRVVKLNAWPGQREARAPQPSGRVSGSLPPATAEG